MASEPVSLGHVSFAAGELSPDMYGRVDIAKYHVGAKRLSNMIVHRQGGTSNRPGTKMIAQAPGNTRLLPFQFSVEQAYVLEFSDNKMRIIKDGGIVLSPLVDATRYQWTASGSGTNEYYLEAVLGGDPGLLPVDIVYEDGVEMTLGSLGSLALNEWGWGDNDTLGYSTLYVRITGGVDPDTQATGYIESNAQIVSPYAYTDLAELRFTQSADTMFLTRYGIDPHTLTREDHYDWTFAAMSFGPQIDSPVNLAAVYSKAVGATTRSISYMVAAVTSDGGESTPSLSPATVTVDSPWGSGAVVTLTWDAVPGADYYNVYKNRSGFYGFVGTSDHTGGGAGSQSFVDDNISPDVADGPKTSVSPFAGGSGRKPGAVGIFEQRVFFGRTNREPQKVWGTNSGTLSTFTESSPPKDDDYIEAKLFSNQVNEIKHLVPMSDSMLILTDSAEWSMSRGENTDAVAPLSLRFKMHSRNGSSEVPPIVVGQDILFTEPFSRVVRDMKYSLESDGYASVDRTIFSNHLFENDAIVEWAFQKSPDSIIWCVMSSGKLNSFTYLPEHDVWAWSTNEIDGEVTSVACIPGGEYDSVYIATRRLVNGAYTQFIELLEDRRVSDIEEAFFVDCGLSYDVPLNISGISKTNPAVVTSAAHGLSNGDGVRINDVKGMTQINRHNYIVANKTTDTFELTDPDGNDIDATGYDLYKSGGQVRKRVSTVSGLDHLEGEAVAVLADGAVVEGLIVSGGAITLTTPAARVHVGLPYESYIETLPIEVQGQQTVQTRKKKISNLTVRFRSTVSAKVGPTAEALTLIDFRTTEDVDQPTQLFTGDKKTVVSPRWGESGGIVIKQDQPLPLTVLSVIPNVVFGDPL